MKFYAFTLIAVVLSASASALATQKAVIVTYPADTPKSVLEQAMSSIREAGGVVTHEYSKFRLLVVLCFSPLTYPQNS